MPIDPLTLLGFGLDRVEQVRGLVGKKVTIKPKSVISHPNNWNAIRPVVITNKTDEPLFDIQIILFSGSENSKVYVEIENSQLGHSEDMDGKIDINTDSFLIGGERNGKNFLLIQVNYLEPHSSKRIFLRPAGSLKTKLEVVRFSTQPSPIATNKNKVGISFAPPFDMNLQSVSLLLKRKT